MNIYNYKHDTKEFTTSGIADESPLEPGVYLIPAHATNVMPPVCYDGEAAIFDEKLSNWSKALDRRGVYWLPNGSEIIITDLNVSPPQEALTIKPDPLPITQEQNIQLIKSMAGQIITTRIPEWKQRNLIARKTELQDQYIDNVPFSTEERAEWDAMAEAWEWVKNVRAASDWAEINKTPVDEIIWPTLRSDLKL